MNEPVYLPNIACAYCNVDLDERNSTEDHVIGEKFVPRGKLDKSWNLVVKACKSCNNELKAELENDISSITLQPDSYGRYAHEDDEVAISEAKRKSTARSKRTGKSVKDSQEHITIKSSLVKGINFSMSLLAPPQIDPLRESHLAYLQLKGFYYLITFDKISRRGVQWIGGFLTLNSANRSDWGNVVQRTFMDLFLEWEHRFFVITAGEFYKASIKKHPDEACWSWALEWNKNLRLVGFFGEEQVIDEVVSQLPRLSFRRETPLEESEDRLFERPS